MKTVTVTCDECKKLVAKYEIKNDSDRSPLYNESDVGCWTVEVGSGYDKVRRDACSRACVVKLVAKGVPQEPKGEDDVLEFIAVYFTQPEKVKDRQAKKRTA